MVCTRNSSKKCQAINITSPAKKTRKPRKNAKKCKKAVNNAPTSRGRTKKQLSDQQISNSPNMEDLPVELKMEIVKNLNYTLLKQMALVSRQFYQITRNKTFITSTKINTDNLDIRRFNTDLWGDQELYVQATKVSNLIRFTRFYGHLIKTLRINADQILLRELIIILNRTPNLSNFYIFSHVKVTGNEFIIELPNIKNYTTYSKVRSDNVGFHKRVLQSVDESLEIEVGETGFKHVADFVRKLNKNLKSLHFSCNQLPGYTHELISKLCTKCRKLERLTINRFKNNLNISDFAMANEFGNNLQELRLMDLYVNGLEFVRMVKFFKNLKRLTLKQCKYITDNDITWANLELSNLEELVIEACPEAVKVNSINSIFKRLTNLRKLVLISGSYNISERIDPFINCLEKLEHLELINIIIPDKLFFHFRFPKLTYMNFTGYKLNDSALEEIIQNCPILQTLINND